MSIGVWRVLRVNPAGNRVDLAGKGSPTNVMVPAYLPMPRVGSEVVFDEASNSVVSILTLDPDNHYTSYIGLPDVHPGEYAMRLPGRGFLLIKNGFKILLGTALNHLLEFDGETGSIKLKTINFSLNGPGYGMSVISGEDPTPAPSFRFTLGNSSIELDSGTRTLAVSLLNKLLHLAITSDNVTVKLSDNIPINIKIGSIFSIEIIKELFKLVFKDLIEIEAPSVHINATDLNLEGVDTALTAGGKLDLSGAYTDISATESLGLSANNITITLGDENMPPAAQQGSFQIVNGICGHIALNSNGEISLGPGMGQGVQVGGCSDSVPSGRYVKQILDLIIQSLMTLAPGVAPLPSASAPASTVVANMVQARIMLEMVESQWFKMGETLFATGPMNPLT